MIQIKKDEVINIIIAYLNLIFTTLSLSLSLQFLHHMAVSYPQLCELISQELKYEVRCLLRRVFSRVGADFSICPSTTPV